MSHLFLAVLFFWKILWIRVRLIAFSGGGRRNQKLDPSSNQNDLCVKVWKSKSESKWNVENQNRNEMLKINIEMKCWKSKSKWNVEIKNRNLFLKSSTLKLMFLNSVDVAIFFFWQKLNFFKFQSLKMYPETKSVSVQ